MLSHIINCFVLIKQMCLDIILPKDFFTERVPVFHFIIAFLVNFYHLPGKGKSWEMPL